MRHMTVVVIGADETAQIAVKRARELNDEIKLVTIEESTYEDVALDMDARAVIVKKNGKSKRVGFDSLIYCCRVESKRVGIEGLEDRDVHSFGEIPSSLSAFKSAVVIGCGRDGIAVSQRLQLAGLSVRMFEKSARVLPRFSFEAAQSLVHALTDALIEVNLQEEIVHGEKLLSGAFRLRTSSGREVETDLIVCACGTSPNGALLTDAGAIMAKDGTVFVDETMLTSLSSVYACGEGISLVKALSSNREYRPSRSMVERGAQVAGTNAACGASETVERMHPCAGTEVIQVGEKFFGRTGLSNVELHQIYAQGSYVRATIISRDYMVRLFAASDTGAILGGEIIGGRELSAHLGLIAQCVVKGLGPQDLIDLDVASVVRDAAERIRSELSRESSSIWGEKLALWLVEQRPFQWVDVSETPSLISTRFKTATHIPFKDLRKKLSELPVNSPLVFSSGSGRSALRAVHLLKKKGFGQVFHVEGGSLSLELLLGKTKPANKA